MSKIKVILSILLMIVLVAAGLILPSLWRNQKKEPDKPQSRPIVAKQEDAPLPDDLLFLDFEDLTLFFSESQVEDLKVQIVTYLKDNQMDMITSVQFFSNETEYPSSTLVRLAFQLSDETPLPVIFRTQTGAFFIGEDQVQVAEPSRTYEKAVDENLPVLTAEDVDCMAEGGYADTKDTDPALNPFAEKPDEKEGTDHKPKEEVQP